MIVWSGIQILSPLITYRSNTNRTVEAQLIYSSNFRALGTRGRDFLLPTLTLTSWVCHAVNVIFCCCCWRTHFSIKMYPDIFSSTGIIDFAGWNDVACLCDEWIWIRNEFISVHWIISVTAKNGVRVFFFFAPMFVMNYIYDDFLLCCIWWKMTKKNRSANKPFTVIQWQFSCLTSQMMGKERKGAHTKNERLVD